MGLMSLRLNSQVLSKKLGESKLNTQITNGYAGMENQLVWPFERHNTTGNSCTAQSQTLSLTTPSRGWDWGPILSPCGPWRPIRLQRYESRISDLRIDYGLDEDLTAANITIRGTVESCPPGAEIEFKIREAPSRICPSGVDVVTIRAIVSDGEAIATVDISDIKLWWPRGHGDQIIYQVFASLVYEKKTLHQVIRSTGFRKCELIREKDSAGESFFFRINNVDVFCGGSNWIPGDSFLPRFAEAEYPRWKRKYMEWLQLLADANQNMVRVWGGGIYEDNFFYDNCDRLGILVWQDFMFACGNYPAHPEFLASIKDEAIENVRRLRRHPSVAIFAGNNEDYQIQESENLTYDPADNNPENWLKTDFPARYIYEKLLPDVVSTEAPNIAYVAGSPFSRPGIPTPDRTTGDIHQWNVWHGTQSPYQLYPTLYGRFVSEFGMEAFPALSTLREFATADHELHAQSATMDFHNKATGAARRLAAYVAENFRVGPAARLEDWVFLTQLLQAEALAFALKGWRRLWGAPQERRVGGVLVWQLNDCWPGVSWSVADYRGRRKAAYYAVKRHLASLAVGVLREHWDWSDGHKVIPKKLAWACWVANGTLQERKGRVQVRFVSVATGRDVKQPIERDGIATAANGTTEVFKGEVDNENEEQYVLVTKLWIDMELVAVDYDWPQPLKYLNLDERGVGISQKWDGRTCSLTITTKKPVKGFAFEETDGLSFSDNGFDIMPDEGVTVEIDGLKDGQPLPSWTYLGI